MQRLQALKFELMPNGEQQHDMRRFAGARRFVFNKALDIQKTNYAAGGKYIGYVDMANLLPEWKKEFEWLKQSPSQTLQQSLKDADKAYKNFFEKRAAFPKFKKRGMGDSFRIPQGFEIDQANSRIKLPKLGWMRYRNSRYILGCRQEHHDQPVRRQMACQHPDRTRSAPACANRHNGHWHRHGDCPLCHLE